MLSIVYKNKDFLTASQSVKPFTMKEMVKNSFFSKEVQSRAKANYNERRMIYALERKENVKKQQ